MRRWQFSWAWFIGAVLASVLSMGDKCSSPPNPGPTPTPVPTATPTPTPVPTPASPCPVKVTGTVYINAKPWGQGLDSTIRVRGDFAFCAAVGADGASDCHLEGVAQPGRAACEMYLAGGCPIWFYRQGDGPIRRLRQDEPDENAMSGDHWGSPPGYQRDDPQTPAFEGWPSECGLQRDSDGNPAAGFFAIVHGAGQARACLPNSPGTCSPWVDVDH